MSEATATTTTTRRIYPALRYRDARAAIRWLCDAFGFVAQAVYDGEDDTIAHAQLTYEEGMIMLGSIREDDFAMKPPKELGHTSGAIYVAVDDPDAHYARAKAAGAEIVREPTDQEYGSRDYSARDPEGYLWSFGTYRP
jgi:uncharacterized glyoxalase superfamily protein PhnB